MSDNVLFYDSREELYTALLGLVERGDFLYMSGDKTKKVPLWHSTTEGIVTRKYPKTRKLDMYMLRRLKTGSLHEGCINETTIGQHVVKLKLFFQHGFRVDKEAVYTSQTGVVGTYHLNVRNELIPPWELVTKTPVTDFLRTVRVGDYVTVWSKPDPNISDFLHYPVLGWLWAKNEADQTLEFINPPNMEVKKFSFTDWKDNITACGYYRKHVLQLRDVKS